MMVVVLLQPLPFAPNLFCSTSLYAQLTLCRSKGWWKLTKVTLILCCGETGNRTLNHYASSLLYPLHESQGQIEDKYSDGQKKNS